MRLFIAIDVSDEVRRAAAELMAKLRASGADCKWVEPENLHLTLRFLGETPAEKIAEVKALMLQACRKPPLAIIFEKLGAFPSWNDPRVIWVGVGQGAGELSALAGELGPDPEGRAFSAHLTIGRVRSRRHLAELRRAAASAGFARLAQRADRLILFESRLTPRGPVYEALHEEKLGARGA